MTPTQLDLLLLSAPLETLLWGLSPELTALGKWYFDDPVLLRKWLPKLMEADRSPNASAARARIFLEAHSGHSIIPTLTYNVHRAKEAEDRGDKYDARQYWLYAFAVTASNDWFFEAFIAADVSLLPNVRT